MTNPIPQWTVRTPHGNRDSVFESNAAAWQFAAANAEAEAPAILTHPEGEVYYIFRESRFIEVSTCHRLVGTTRRVVKQ